MQSILDLILAANGSSHIRSAPAPTAMSFTTMGRVTADAVVENVLQLLTSAPGP
jgi:hypothetical protein